MSSRWHLPAPPLRGSTLIGAAAALVFTALGIVLGRSAFDLSAAFLLKAGIASLLALVTAIGFVGAHHPFPRFGAANVVTAIRLALVALLAGLLGEPHRPTIEALATIVTIVVTVLDGVDGWLARHSALASAFGARFDMETDALLILVLAALAWQWDRAGAWVLACGLMRYAFVAAAAPWPWMERPLPPSLRRKAVCVVQIVGLAIVVSPAVHRPLSAWMAAGTLVLLGYSFLVDVVWLFIGRLNHPIDRIDWSSPTRPT